MKVVRYGTEGEGIVLFPFSAQIGRIKLNGSRILAFVFYRLCAAEARPKKDQKESKESKE